jgi:hypothetical protein
MWHVIKQNISQSINNNEHFSEQKYHLTAKHLTFNEQPIEHLTNKHVNV